MPRTTSAVAVSLIAGLACTLAGAQTIEWAAPVSGNWNLAANWSPDRLPNATDSVLIGGAGVYEVIHNAPSASILELAITNPGTTLSILGGRTVTINGGLMNNGLLVLNSNGANATTTLYFGVNASFLGEGILRLNRSSTQAQLTGGPGVVVTNGPSHTIAGYGRIFSAGLVNNGTIDADVESQALTVEGSDTTNNALMSASAGRLELLGTTIVQGAQSLILANGGEVLIGQGVFIDGGQLASEPGSRVVRSFSGSSSLRDVSFSGTMYIFGGSTTSVFGAGLTNDGVITVNANGSNVTTVFRFTQSGSLGGSGVVRLNRSLTQAQLTGSNRVVLTHGSSHTIAGFGQISAELINNGIINADVESQTLRVTGSVKTNNALMAASAGTLELLGTTVVQGAQGLILADGGEVLIGQDVMIDGGHLASDAGGRVARASGTSTLKNVLFSGTMDISGGSITVVSGVGLTNNGVITVNADSSNTTTTVRFDDSGHLVGAGTLRLNRATTLAGLASVTDAVITHGADHTIAGFGQISAELINNGTIDADVENQTLSLTGSAKTNNALMAASAGTLELLGATVVQGAQGLILAEGGEVLIGSGVTIEGGRIESEPGSRVVTASGTSTLKDVSFSGAMDIIGGSATVVSGAGLTNNGVMTVNADGSNTTTAIRFVESGMLGGSGVVRLNRTTSLAQISTPANISAEIGEGQTVKGIGRISGEFLLRGATAPGLEDPGSMELIGDITLAPTHTLEVRIGGPSSSIANYDRVTSATDLKLGGALSVETIDNYTPEFGQSYTMLSGLANSISGRFDEIIQTEPLPQGLVYRVVYAPNQVRLNVTCIADMNADFIIDADDFFTFLSLFAAADPQADINEDGVIDADDFFAFLVLFAAGC